MQKVSNILPYFKSHLKDVSNEREITSWCYIVLKHLLSYNRSDCIINHEKVINSEITKKIDDIITELKNHKPIQYILKETEFYGLKFIVNNHTLIPRIETEELVDWVLKDNFSSVLDIGTGSGCISIALAKNTNAQITAIDISEEALKLAKKNAEINKVEINFFSLDILNAKVLPKVDLIVSNPPYVLNSEKVKMTCNILDFEPSLALFVKDEDPIIFYKKIADLAFNNLNTNGKLFFEINERFGSEIILMLSQIGFVDIELKKDLNDKDRMIKAVKK